MFSYIPILRILLFLEQEKFLKTSIFKFARLSTILKVVMTESRLAES